VNFGEFWRLNGETGFDDHQSPTFSVTYQGTLADYEKFRPQILRHFQLHAEKLGVDFVCLSEPVITESGFIVFGVARKR
jgi:hypothetical protein